MNFLNVVKTVPVGENVNENDGIQWHNCHASDPGHQYFTDEDIVSRAKMAVEFREHNEEEESYRTVREIHEMTLKWLMDFWNALRSTTMDYWGTD